MKWLVRIVAVVAVVAAVVTGVGSALPREHVAARTLDTARPVDTVFALVADMPGQPRWRRDLARVEPLAAAAGRERWREVYGSGDAVVYETVASEPPRRLVRRIADEGAPFSGEWEITVAPTSVGSRVTVTERGRVPNPVFRFVSRYLVGHTVYIDRYLTALAATLGERAPRLSDVAG